MRTTPPGTWDGCEADGPVTDSDLFPVGSFDASVKTAGAADDESAAEIHLTPTGPLGQDGKGHCIQDGGRAIQLFQRMVEQRIAATHSSFVASRNYTSTNS